MLSFSLFPPVPCPVPSRSPGQIASLIRYWGWKRVCAMNAKDAYSQKGMDAFISNAGKEGLDVAIRAQWTEGSTDVSTRVKELADSMCKIVILFAQSSEMNNVFKAADVRIRCR